MSVRQKACKTQKRSCNGKVSVMARSARSLPSLSTIPAGMSFVDTLAATLWNVYADDPALFAGVRILVPTRRAVRSLRDAFLRQAHSSSREALLLPRIQPLGDVDEEDLIIDPAPMASLTMAEVGSRPVISPLRRQLRLAHLIKHWSEVQQSQGKDLGVRNAAQAVALAVELGRLLDLLQTEGVTTDRFTGLVPDAYTEHWQDTVAFLKIIHEHWPAYLEEEQCVDAVERRNATLRGLADRWRHEQPQTPIIAAGSTGSIPATAYLLDVIARLPAGAVVLPGLDITMDEKAWAVMDPSHPQYGMKELLGRMDVDRSHVTLWPGCEDVGATRQSRSHILHAALRPADATEDWRDVVERFQEQNWDMGLDGLTCIDAVHAAEEAVIIALILRHTLEDPGKTGALVTPDRQLARRVAAHLKRWEIAIDDSAGTPLNKSPVGSFMRLIVEAAHEEASPLFLLSVLKHPLCAAGLNRQNCRDAVEQLELIALRDSRPKSGIGGLRKRYETMRDQTSQKLSKETKTAIEKILTVLDAAFSPFIDALNANEISLQEMTEHHIRCAEMLAAEDGDDGGHSRLWSHDDGEAMASFMRQLHDDAIVYPKMRGSEYLTLFETVLSGQVLRPTYGTHPRLFIWGPMEARLQHADVVVLGGLNEGTWPGESRLDPWLNRPMRKELGLPMPERQVGLSAHDFAQLASSEKVFLTRAERVDGAPTVASRWLLRMETILRGAKAFDCLAPDYPYQQIVQQCDKVTYVPRSAPEPRPPVKARPRTFSVTDIETWIRDPYAIYAKKILNLRPLNPIDMAVDRMQHGTVIHKILETFVAAYPDDLPDNATEQLLKIANDAFSKIEDQPNVEAFWKPRFEDLAHWFVATERERRLNAKPLVLEQAGVVLLPGPAGDVQLKCRVDRIDQCQDGLVIYDYKTGVLPSKKEVQSGLSPQLSLEAYILAQGGFENVARQSVVELTYLQVKGGAVPGEVRTVASNCDEVTERLTDASEGVIRLIAEFDQEETPYLSQPRVQFLRRFADYDHLARVQEWSAGGGEEDV